MTATLCIFGFGYTAKYLAAECEKADFKVIGTSRNPTLRAKASQSGYQLIDFSIAELQALKIKPTHLLISTPPSLEVGDPVLKEFKAYLSSLSTKLQWLGYLSTTGVYGDHQGAWVNEATAPQNPSLAGKLRLEAEEAWSAFAKEQQLPCFIFRSAGIYGPYRNALQLLKKGKEFSIYKEGQVFSRIHVKDLAKAIKAALEQPEAAGIYNICDDEPAPSQEVDSYAAQLLGLRPPPLRPYEEAGLSKMALDFYSSNRRVSNLRMKEELGVKLEYPNYRVGLKALYEDGLY